MLRIGAMVIAIAAAAFALNLFLFDSADSTGSAGRLSPRASEAPLRTVTTERAPSATDRRATTTDDRTRTDGRTTAAPDDRGRGSGDRSDDRGSDDRSGRGGSDDSSGSGSGEGDDGGGGHGRGRGGEDD